MAIQYQNSVVVIATIVTLMTVYYQVFATVLEHVRLNALRSHEVQLGLAMIGIAKRNISNLRRNQFCVFYVPSR